METNKYGPKLADRLRVGGEAWPEIPSDLLAFLERLFPERCFNPSKEREHEHFAYAGKCQLVKDMRAQHDDQRAHPDTAIIKEF